MLCEFWCIFDKNVFFKFQMCFEIHVCEHYYLCEFDPHFIQILVWIIGSTYRFGAIFMQSLNVNVIFF